MAGAWVLLHTISEYGLPHNVEAGSQGQAPQERAPGGSYLGLHDQASDAPQWHCHRHSLRQAQGLTKLEQKKKEIPPLDQKWQKIVLDHFWKLQSIFPQPLKSGPPHFRVTMTITVTAALEAPCELGNVVPQTQHWRPQAVTGNPLLPVQLAERPHQAVRQARSLNLTHLSHQSS